ncbi:MAG TPA: DUF4396 domain-containing protein [Halococcus sp.]|nr:DUF4396 domain-containing protein [Halococcus sp.]
MPLEEALQHFLTNPTVLAVWAIVILASLAILAWDIHENNAEMVPLMKFAWGLSAVYSGPIALGAYWYAGRSQISHDSTWRGGWRSVTHCYSGCGAGEIVGVVVLAGVLAITSTAITAVVTFALAYVFGFALSMGPEMQEGVGFDEALRDAFYSETASITFMELAAIGTDIWLAASAQFTELLFWSGLFFSLSIGYLVAYPVNVFLVYRGVKGGMQDPTERRQAA